MTMYYVPEVHGNFFELKDALLAALGASMREGGAEMLVVQLPEKEGGLHVTVARIVATLPVRY